MAIETLLFFLFLSLCIGSWIAQDNLYKRIKKSYPEKWVGLGKPTLSMMLGGSSVPPWEQLKFSKQMSRAQFRTLRYVIKGDPELDSDPNILKLKRINQRIYLIAIGIFVAFVLLGAFYPHTQM